MRAVDVIAKKRDGRELGQEELQDFILAYTRGEVADYQAAAWLMAVYLRGMTHRETVDLTEAMVRSGRVLDLSDIAPFVVDKHSTGGVGDKTTIVVAPLVASLGVPVAKMSGRGLGFTGGTIDKLESIPGFTVDLSADRFRDILQSNGLVLSGQSTDLAPADGKLYALRDVTATVSSLPLIASSIMSKKIASGANGIVLDVKVGKGAFMRTLEDAVRLSETMVSIGKALDRRMGAVISAMDQPLGNAVGNALEVVEAIETLKGNGPADFTEHCLVLATRMLLLADVAADPAASRLLLQQSIQSGRALETFRRWVQSQGGDPGVVDRPGAILPHAAIQRTVLSPATGWVQTVHAEDVGVAAMHLGGGRHHKHDPIDHSVGVVFRSKVGSRVEHGEPLFDIHANHPERVDAAEQRVLAAYRFADQPVTPPGPILQIL